MDLVFVSTIQVTLVIDLRDTFCSLSFGKYRSAKKKIMGSKAPIKKNHSMGRYMEPSEKRRLGPMRPQKTAFVA